MNSDHFPDFREYTGHHFFNKTSSSLPVQASTADDIISLIESNEGCQFHFIEIIFVNEAQIKTINREYLQRKYVTDVITFPYNTQNTGQKVEGTLYCCAPRIYEQAKEYEQLAEREFKRVIIHGLLHLVGYDDQSERDRETMKKREAFYLQKLDSSAAP